MMQREKQSEWLANLIIENSKNRQINILGKTFKPETNLILGSPFFIIKKYFIRKTKKVFSWDPYIDEKYEAFVCEKYNWTNNKISHVFFIGTKHPDFIKFKYPMGEKTQLLLIHLDIFIMLKMKIIRIW